MDIETLMFMKATAPKGPKKYDPIYFSANGPFSPGGTPLISNSYGTTLSTTSAENNSVVITQVPNQSYYGEEYQNGFVNIGFEKIPEWTSAGKKIIFDADIKVSDNPLSQTTFLMYLNNKHKYMPFADGKLHAELTGINAYARNYVELRCMGCCFTLSNCKLYCE